MITRELTIEFVTPAFLGGANQAAEWRTPPFKALLRQWWRVWASHRVSPDYPKVREAEGVVFGDSFLRHRAPRGKPEQVWQFRSPLRLRLMPWAQGNLQKWRFSGKVYHPEVQSRKEREERRGRDISADLYLGFGPLQYDPQDRVTKLHCPPAIAAGARAKLSLGFPAEIEWEDGRRIDLGEGIDTALRLAHLLGTVGGRSRNGWGSLRIMEEGRDLASLDEIGEVLTPYSRPLEEALGTDWADAVGTDERGLLAWQVRGGSLEEVIKKLARVKIAFRTALDVGREKKGSAHPRHLLGYPVTHHGVRGWNRLASQVRFKVHRQGNGYVGLAVHLPCGLPQRLRSAVRLPRGQDLHSFELETWKKVHEVLDREMMRVG